MSRGAIKFPDLLASSLAHAITPSTAAKRAAAERLRPLKVLQMLARVQAAWQWLVRKRQAQQNGRQLQLVETLQLGEKRFIAVIEAGGTRYLVGGGAGQLSLLTRLDQQSSPPSTPQFAASPAWEQP